jgi:hypothetical protein
MPSKPIELPPEVAKAFVRDMHAFFNAGAPVAGLTRSPRSNSPR